MQAFSSARFIFSLLVACSTLAAPAAAETVLSNLSLTSSSTDSVDFGVWRAAGFTTDNNQWSLTGATLRFANGSDASGNLFVKIWGDDSGRPGGVALATLAGDANPITAGEYTYTTAGFSLAPLTKYWLVAGVSSGSGSYKWLYVNNGGAPVADGVWTMPAVGTYSSTRNQGAAWSAGANGYPYMFSLSATAVPEIDPAGMGSVLALISGAFGLLERRRLKAKVA